MDTDHICLGYGYRKSGLLYPKRLL